MKNLITTCTGLLICIAMVAHAQEWTILSVGTGAKPAIAVDTNDIPHVAYLLESQPGYVRHAMMEGNAFTESLVHEAYYYGPLDIAISPESNYPAIAVHNHDDEDEDVYVRDVTGTWNRLQVAHNGHDGWDNSIAYDAQGIIHTTSVDPQNFGSDIGVEYAFYDDGEWQVEEIGSGPIPYMFSTSLDIDSEGDPHVVYFSPGNDAAMYAVRKDGSWTHEMIEPEGGYFPNIALDAMNNPHISFYKETGDNAGDIRYATKKGDLWTIQTIDMLNLVPISFTGARHVTAIAVDDQNRPHVSYGDRDYVRYAFLNAGEWQIETIADFSMADASLGAQTDLDLDSQGNPHITYFQVESFSPLTGIIMYAYKQLSSGVAQPRTNAGLSVYPNPAGQYVVVKSLEDSFQQSPLSIYNASGQTAYQGELTERAKVIDTSSWAPGLYVIRFQGFAEKILIAR
jgi:hypothetical protein